jgi:hypothetical protein
MFHVYRFWLGNTFNTRQACIVLQNACHNPVSKCFRGFKQGVNAAKDRQLIYRVRMLLKNIRGELPVGFLLTKITAFFYKYDCLKIRLVV